MTTLTELVTSAPAPTHGHLTQFVHNLGVWRWVVQLADPDAGAGVVWHDITGFCSGVSIERGADEFGGRYTASVAEFGLRTVDDRLAPWNPDTSATFGVHVRLGAGLLIRCGFIRVLDGATVEVMLRGTWRVESWRESTDDHDGTLRRYRVTGRDLLADLNAVPVGIQASPQNWPDRVDYVLTDWPFGHLMYGAATTDGVTDAFTLPDRDHQASALAELDATVDPVGLMAFTNRNGHIVVRPIPGDTFHAGLLAGAGTGAAWTWPLPVVFSHAADVDGGVAFKRRPGSGEGFGFDDTDDNVINRFIVTDPAGDYDTDDPISAQRYGHKPVQLSWIAAHDSLVDLLLDQRAFASMQARPMVTDHTCRNFFPAAGRIDFQDPLTIRHQTAPGRLVVTADATVRHITEHIAPGVGVTRWRVEVTADVAATDTSAELLPPENMTVASVDHESALVEWDDPAGQPITPTATQVRLSPSPWWIDAPYPLGVQGWLALAPTTTYTFEARYIAEVDGLIVAVSPATSVEFTTLPGPSIDGDLNGQLPDPDEGCEIEWELQGSDDGETWTAVTSGTAEAGGTVVLGPEWFDEYAFYRLESIEVCGGVPGTPQYSTVIVPECSTPPVDPPFDDASLVMYVPELCKPDRIIEAVSQVEGVHGQAFDGVGAHDGSVIIYAGAESDWVAVGPASGLAGLVGDKTLSWRGLITADVALDRLLWAAGVRIGCQSAVGGWKPTLTVILEDGSTISTTSTTVFDTDEVYTIAATFEEATGTARLYVDSVEVGDVTAAVAPATTQVLATVYSLGAIANGWATDAAVWSSVLTFEPPPPPLPTGGLFLSLVADDLIATIANGDPVTTWPDTSGNDRDFGPSSYAGVDPPILHYSVVNGRAAVRFAGASNPQGLTGPAAMGSGLTSAHVFIVLKCDNDPGSASDNTAEPLTWGGDNSEGHTHYAHTDGDVYSTLIGSERGQHDPTVALNAWHCFEVSADATTHAMRWNGGTVYDTGGVFSVAAITQPEIGENRSVYAGSPTLVCFDGDIAAILVYNHVLSTDDRASVVNWINDQYSIGMT